MNIKTLSKKLRHVADVLDELIELDASPAIAKRIIKRAKPHWTQLPENKAKLRKVLKRMKYAKQNS